MLSSGPARNFLIEINKLQLKLVIQYGANKLTDALFLLGRDRCVRYQSNFDQVQISLDELKLPNRRNFSIR